MDLSQYNYEMLCPIRVQLEKYRTYAALAVDENLNPKSPSKIRFSAPQRKVLLEQAQLELREAVDEIDLHQHSCQICNLDQSR